MANILQPLTAGQVFCNGRQLLTPDGEVIETVWCSRRIFCPPGWEELNPKKRVSGPRAPVGTGNEKGARRACKELYQLARCNDFNLFVTFTLDKAQVDRYDAKEVIKRLNVWLDNRVRRKDLRYVLVPERHKDGAIHFHGLINSDAVKLRDSGHTDRAGRTIYNVTDWKFGFTTAVFLDGQYPAVCRYVSKYITKQVFDGQGLVAGRYFYRGGNLQHPTVRYFDLDETPTGKEYKIEDAGISFIYF